MSTERNFSTFEPGDSVTALGNGVIGDMAEFAGIELPSGHGELVDSLGRLVSVFGKNKVLRDNAPLDLPLETAYDWAQRSGISRKLNRTLWSPGQPAVALDAVVATGGVANWQDRTADLLVKHAIAKDGILPDAFIVTGNRKMQSATEATNANVVAYADHFGTSPTETEYADAFVVPALRAAGYSVSHHAYEETDGSKIAFDFARNNRDLWYPEVKIGFARVATAGIQLAMQFRLAAQQTQRFEVFDTDQDHPQAVVMTDEIPLAQDSLQLADPLRHQSPYTALRQAAVTAKLLLDADILR